MELIAIFFRGNYKDLAPTEHALALEMSKLQADAQSLFKSFLARIKRVHAYGAWDLRARRRADGILRERPKVRRSASDRQLPIGNSQR
jgi:hypothetical protein